MTTRFAVRIVLRRPPWDALNAAFQNDLFFPVALGSFDGTGKKIDHWLIAGRALEDHVARLIAVRGQRASASALIGWTREDHRYLQIMDQRIGTRNPSIPPRSPFERVDPAVHATFLPEPHLRASVLSHVRSFYDYERRPFSSVDLAGTVDLVVDDPGDASWLWAFRELLPSADELGRNAVPFLSLTAVRLPEDRDRVILLLWTESCVWLRGGGALGGRVGPRAADENLARLAGFVRCLSQGAERIPLVIPADSPAQAESDRLREMLLPA